jgi:hypothetical protein
VTGTLIKLALVLPTGPKGHSIRDQVANTLNTIHILYTHVPRSSRAHVTSRVPMVIVHTYFIVERKDSLFTSRWIDNSVVMTGVGLA